MAIEKEIIEHDAKGLRVALETELKRRKRSKKMGLFPKDEPGRAMFFSPDKIAVVRAHQLDLNAQKQQKALNEERQRLAKAADKQRKTEEAGCGGEARVTRRRERGSPASKKGQYNHQGQAQGINEGIEGIYASAQAHFYVYSYNTIKEGESRPITNTGINRAI